MGRPAGGSGLWVFAYLFLIGEMSCSIFIFAELEPNFGLLLLQVRRLKGIRELVKLFNSDSQEVQRFATGATRNLIFENMDNKVELIEEGGIPQLIEALRENDDDELRKNITGGKMASSSLLRRYLFAAW